MADGLKKPLKQVPSQGGRVARQEREKKSLAKMKGTCGKQNGKKSDMKC
jgi:hypothetical protein